MIDATTVTFFPDFAAGTKREETICLRDLADRIITTSARPRDMAIWRV